MINDRFKISDAIFLYTNPLSKLFKRKPLTKNLFPRQVRLISLISSQTLGKHSIDSLCTVDAGLPIKFNSLLVVKKENLKVL